MKTKFLIISALIVAGILHVGTVMGETKAFAKGTQSLQAAKPQPGRALVAMPDGSFLSIGGQTSQIATADVFSIVSKAGVLKQAVIGQLLHARANHTATLLPDGRILVLGGEDINGTVVDHAEIFDPVTVQSKLLDVNFLARAGHTATMLLDGQVLIVGGVDERGTPIATAELWNSYSGYMESVGSRLEIARYQHGANWTEGTEVQISGGIGENKEVLGKNERYTPDTQTFALEQTGLSSSILPKQPRIVESLPNADTRDVAVGAPLAIRFDRAMEVTTLSAKTVTLFGPDGVVKVKVMPVENGQLLFVTPLSELRPDAAYTLFIHGAKDNKGAELPFAATGFRTAKLGSDEPSEVNTADSSSKTDSPANPGQDQSDDAKQEAVADELEDDEIWRPGPQHRKGNWRHGRLYAHSRDAMEIARSQKILLERLPEKARVRLRDRMRERGELVDVSSNASPLKSLREIGATLLPGAASVSGQALRLNGKPLANVTMTLGASQTRTDANGEFTLANVPVGPQVLVIDGRSAGKTTGDYGRYEFQIDVRPGYNDLPFTIWMTRLDKKNAVRIASPTQQETVVTHPNIPGLELRIPAGAVIRDADGKIVTEVSITPVPVDKMPFPMPYSNVDVFYTIQPGGARILSANGKPVGATLRYPNYSTQPAGAKVQLFDYDPYGRGWYIYSTGTVSQDGRSIQSAQPFTIYQFAASSVATSGGAAGKNGKSCNSNNTAGDPVICSTGVFVEENTDMVVRDIAPIEIYREYQHDNTNQGAFGIGSKQFHDLYIYFQGVSGFTAQSVQLVLPSGVGIVFRPISSNIHLPSGAVYESQEPGPFFKARFAITNSGWGSDFALTLKDGTRYGFSFSQTKLKWIEDRHGNRTTITRNAYGVSRIVSPNGRWVEFERNVPSICSGCVTKISDHTGRSVQYEYEAQGRLQKITDPEGKYVEYIYDTSGRIRQVIDARRNTKVVNEYYSSADTTNPLKIGRVKRQVYPDGTDFRFDYEFDAANTRILKTTAIDERGAIREIEYDENTNVVKNTYGKGSSYEHVWAYERDPATGLLLGETDPLGKKTRYTYDAAGKGNIEKVTLLEGEPEQISWNFTYEPLYNQLDVITDPLGRKIDYDYDASGKLRSIKNDLGHTVTVTHTAAGQVETLTQVAGTQQIVSRFTYGDGLVTGAEHAGRMVHFNHDALGRVIGIKDGLGRLSFLYYDGRDLITKRCNGAGECAVFEYDENRNLKHFERGATQRDFTYDKRNRVETEGRGAQVEVAYANTYFPGGHTTTRTEASGRVASVTHDVLGRPKQAQYHNGGVTTRTVDYQWDKRNRLETIGDSVAGTLSYAYDDRFDAIKQETGPTGYVKYSYYANGLRESMQPQGGTKIAYGYDAGNQLRSITQAAGTGNPRPLTPQAVLFDYDDAGRRSRLTLANGITLDYGWNEHGELEMLSYKQADGTPIGDLVYDYDAASQRIGQRGSFAREDRPSARVLPIDPGTGRLQADNGAPIVWDAEGRLQQDASKTYIWNDVGQLAEIRDTATNGVLASFAYDPIGRRMQKTVGTTTVQYLHDGINPIQLQGSTGAVLENLLAGGVDEWFARTRGGSTSHYLTDALGSALRLADATGAKIVDYTYDPYGGTSSDQAGDKNVFQYTGRENDGTGLYYYRARYYNPKWGRFISQDPIGLAGDDNLYAYVEGDPISYTDPTGEIAWGVAFAAANLGWQLYQNGGNLGCVNWTSVGLSMVGGGLANGLLKGAFKFKMSGSNSWSATSKWMNNNGIMPNAPGQQRHHWLFQQNQGLGQNVSNAVKNQPWNINNVSASFNNWMGQGPWRSGLGAPSWATQTGGGAAIAAGGAIAGQNCGCQ